MLFEHWGATTAERQAQLPGDDLIADPPVSATRSISLAATPDEVFGWLAQMGFGKAGWYSYDLLDNLGRRSAKHLEPSWQVDEAGASVPGGPISFAVTHLRRPDHLVLAIVDQRLAGHRIDFTLAYRLHPLEPDQADPTGHHHPSGHRRRTGTRLVSRARIKVGGLVGGPATVLVGAGDGVMVRRQLLGLAERCGRWPT